MKRMFTALLALLAALAVCCAAPAEGVEEAEPQAPETGAEAACAHEHINTVYYFDSPDYIPLDAESHRVSGLAEVEEVCLDCGATVAGYTDYSASEIRPHVFLNGACALCGFENPAAEEAPRAEEPAGEADATGGEPVPAGEEAAAEEEVPAGEELPAEELPVDELPAEELPAEELPAEDAPRAEEPAAAAAAETVVMIRPGQENPGQYFYTVTGRELEEAGEALVLWPEGCDAALVLQAEPLRQTVGIGGGSVTAEFEKPGGQNVRASVRLYRADGTESRPDSGGISLRIYGQNTGSPLLVTCMGPDGQVSYEEASWEKRGYWTVRWMGDGSYTYR